MIVKPRRVYFQLLYAFIYIFIEVLLFIFRCQKNKLILIITFVLGNVFYKNFHQLYL